MKGYRKFYVPDMIFVMDQAFKEILNLQFIANIRDSFVTLVWDEYFSI